MEGIELKLIRLKAGSTPKEFSTKLNIRQTFYYDLEAGRRKISDKIVNQINNVLRNILEPAKATPIIHNDSDTLCFDNITVTKMHAIFVLERSARQMRKELADKHNLTGQDVDSLIRAVSEPMVTASEVTVSYTTQSGRGQLQLSGIDWY